MHVQVCGCASVRVRVCVCECVHVQMDVVDCGPQFCRLLACSLVPSPTPSFSSLLSTVKRGGPGTSSHMSMT